MTSILAPLFDTIGVFLKYAPGTETSSTLEDLNASAIAARKRVTTIISDGVYKAIEKEKEGEAFESLRSVMANLTLANQLIFDTVARKKSDTNIYKYEVEAMKRGYMENYYNAMDTLIQELSSHEEEGNEASDLWRKSRYFSILESCKIATAEDFDSIYPIDLSYLFFFHTVPLQRECLRERISTYYDRITEDNKDTITPLLELALAKKTIAKALRRFDILDFPPTIRNLFDSNTASRSGSDEHSQAMELAARLDSEADELLASVDALLTDSSQLDYSTVTSFNRPDDKIVMLP